MPQWIFSLTSLVSLDLSSCNFHGLVPSSINSFRNLTSLELLHVSWNDFMNSSSVLEALSSSNLISLDISRCGISSSLLDSLYNLTSLISLDLSSNELTSRIPKSLGNLCILREIGLSSNNIGNISLAYFFESFFDCESPALESLILSWNKVAGIIPHSIGQLSFLKKLDLSGNQISGPIPYSIGRLSSLEVLDVAFNQLKGSLPDSIGRLSSLKTLYLSYNQLNGSLPDSIGRLSSLEVLDVMDNQLKGSLPDSIGRLSSLKMLDLSYNQLNGSLPDSIGRLSSLETLSLSHNQLNGNLPDSIGQLSKLSWLDFSYNLMIGIVTETQFKKLESMYFLDGTCNKLTLRLKDANWIPPFQIEYLFLRDWVLGPQLPLWLQSQKDLVCLDISNTSISSPMPESFLRSFPNLGDFNIAHNNIRGAVTFSGITTTLQEVDFSSNEFWGSLDDVLCSTGVMTTLVLNLGNNHFSGVIPKCWEKWSNLVALNLENNNLSGEIPLTLGSLVYMHALNLHGNKISGGIPSSLMNLTKLYILQLGRNELVGSIPTWIGTNLTLLKILNLRSNNFDGNIPHEVCNLIHVQILDLAHNNLSGNIPRCFNNFSVLSGIETNSKVKFNFTSRAQSSIAGDSLVMKGREDTYSTILGLVMLLDLSSNNFVGHIPSELTSLIMLKSLNLSRNQLTGPFPEKIGDMKALISLDLSLNKLSGKLPVSLSRLTFLSSFNVSYNNLVGRIPGGTQIQSFNESSFLGNKLYGAPLTGYLCNSMHVT